MRDDALRYPKKGRVVAALLVTMLAATLLAIVPVRRADADDVVAASVVRVGDVSIMEGPSGRATAAPQLSLSRPLDHDLTVAVVTRDLTATAPSDYRAISAPKSIKIRAGKTSATVSIAVYGDATAEPDEQLRVEVTGTTDPDVLGGQTGTVTVLDDDAGADGHTQLGLGAAVMFEGSSGRTTVKVPVTLTEPLAHDVSFNVYSFGGSANGPDDFKPIDKRVRIKAGRVSAAVAVQIVGDVVVESDEEFFLQIVGVSDQAVDTTLHSITTVTIRDDEPPVAPGNIYSYLFGHPVVLQGPTAPGWVHLTWDEPIGGGVADGYELELSRDNATWQTLATTATPTYDHFCGLYNQLCQYRVTPRNAGGTGPTAFLGAVVTQAPSPPGVPLTFTAELADPATPGLVGLEWSAPDAGGAVEVYRVEWRDLSDSWQEIYYGAGLTTHHDCGLPATVCEYRITAANTGGESPWRSTEVTTRTVPGIPGTVVAQTTPESRAIVLSWSAPASDGGMPITGYAVRYTGEADDSGEPPVGAAWTVVETASLTATIDSCGPTAAGTATCWLQVRAVNSVGNGAWSAGTAVATWVTPAPGPLDGIEVALGGPTVPGWVELTWTPGTSGGTPAVYDVEMSRDGASWQPVAHTTEAHLAHYCGLYELTCMYRVTPVNVGGTGPMSWVGPITTEAPALPGTPLHVSATLAGADALGLVVLAWGPPSTGGPVQAYRVERRVDDNSWETIYAGADVHTHNACGVPNLMCEYRVVALNSAGDGPAATASVITQTGPDAPTSFVAVAQFGSRSVALRWGPRMIDGGSPILRYRVRMTTDIDTDGQARWNSAWMTSIVGGASTSTIATCSGGPRPSARCRFEIRAENALGASAWSAGAIVTTFVAPPHDPKPGTGPDPSAE